MIDDISDCSSVRFRIAYSARAFRPCVRTSRRGAVPTSILACAARDGARRGAIGGLIVRSIPIRCLAPLLLAGVVACAASIARGADRGAVPTDIDWNTSPLDLDLRGMNGERYTFHCPPGKPQPSHVVGSGPYTDASSICSVAVHAGVLHAQRGGDVRIEIRPGEPRYIGSERHYLHSADEADGWSGSFIVIEPGSDAGHP